jgi:CMP-N-acetylneuraminic acid synthetase
MKKLLVTICARGGSKGIPGKNIKDLNGKPLIAYSIEVAKKLSAHFDVKVALSTDSDEIIRVAAKCGLETDYKRPAELATDKAGKLAAFYDVYEFEKKNGRRYDYVLDLDVTSPLRNVEDILNAYKLLEEDPASTNIFSVSKAHKNPYFNMVEQNEKGYVKICKQPDDNVLSRQAAPEVFEMNASFYIFRASFFDEGIDSIFTDTTLLYNVPHMCFDLDEPIDFEFMGFLMANDKLDFSL